MGEFINYVDADRVAVVLYATEEDREALERYCERRGYEVAKATRDLDVAIDEAEWYGATVVTLPRCVASNARELLRFLKVLRDAGVSLELADSGARLERWEDYDNAIKLIETALALERRGRRPVELPISVIERYLDMGLSKKDVYRILVERGYLRYKEKGEEKVLSYHQFLRRLKRLGL